MAKRIKPTWKVRTSFVGEAPADGERILRDIKRLVSYNRTFGRIRNYAYFQGYAEEEDVYDYMIESTDKGERKTLYRHFLVKVELLNRVWQIRTTPSGLTLRFPVAV